MKIAIINAFDTYEHRVDLLMDYFSKTGNEVKVFSSNYKHIEKTIRTDIKPNYYFINTKVYSKNLSLRRMISHWKFSKDAFQSIEGDFDLLWVLIPPNSMVNQAIKYKEKNIHTKLVFDLIDLWPETMPIGKLKKTFPFSFWKKLRDSKLHKANYIVTECNLYRKSLPSDISRDRVSTLYLSYGNINKVRDNNLLDFSGKEISICYLGSMNNIIDNDMIVNIIRNLSKNLKINFYIIGNGEKKQELLGLLSSIQNLKVYDYGKVYNDKVKTEVLSKCHFGLNIMKDDVYVGLTMKSLDYFKNGLPIINNIKGDTWDFVKDLGVGVNTSNGKLDKNILKNYVSKFSNVQHFYNNNFSQEHFFAELESILEKLRSQNEN